MTGRDSALDQLQSEMWDIAVIGGGATGLGAAVDAASRGFRTILLERSDFASETSSRSTKLIHGGVRYLKQGNISLVRESLRERELLLRNAAGLVQPLEFVIPAFSRREQFFYAAGLKMYDFLAGRSGIPPSRMLSTAQVKSRVSTIKSDRLKGGVSYFDAQFDDARMALALVAEVGRMGSVALNYVSASGLLKQGDRVCGIVAEDMETGKQFEVRAKGIINATGVFTDSVRQLDCPEEKPILKVSRGSHLVLDRAHLPGNAAIIIPSTDDGRVIFMIPWHGATVVGTTDLPEANAVSDPFPVKAEIDFLLDHANRYLQQDVTCREIRSMFCGLRPLVRQTQEKSTASLSRDHVVLSSSSGLVSVAGGKWTTYRKMGIDAVDAVINAAGLEQRTSMTDQLAFDSHPHDSPLAAQNADHITDEFVQSMIRKEQARTVDDILSRRCRLLLLDAQAAIRVAPLVAARIAKELGRDAEWELQQISEFTTLAKRHLCPG